jgi:hypothetical protein
MRYHHAMKTLTTVLAFALSFSAFAESMEFHCKPLPGGMPAGGGAAYVDGTIELEPTSNGEIAATGTYDVMLSEVRKGTVLNVKDAAFEGAASIRKPLLFIVESTDPKITVKIDLENLSGSSVTYRGKTHLTDCTDGQGKAFDSEER